MKFEKITIENFKSIGPEPITVNLNRNCSTLLLGKNGAGKTTVFDAIVWCIYGYTKLKADNVVNKTIGSGAKVEIEFSENGKKYVITRYRKHKTHKNNLYVFEDGNNITLKNPSDNQELVNKIVGMDSRAFLASIILSSENYKQFLRETNAVRLQIFESVFSLRELNDLSKLNKVEMKTIESKISNIDTEIKTTAAYIESDETALKKYKETYEATKRKMVEDNESDLAKIATYEEAITEFGNIDISVEMQAAIDYNKAKTLYDNEKQRFDEYTKSLRILKGQEATYLKNLAAMRNFIDENNVDFIKSEVKKNNDFKENSIKLDELKSKKEELSLKTVDLISSVKMLEADVGLNSKKKQHVLDDLKELSENICPTCGQEMDKEKSAALRIDLNNELNSLDAFLMESEEKLQVLNMDVTNNKSTLSSINDEINQLQLDINNNQPKYSLTELKRIIDTVKIYSSEIVTTESELDSIRQDIETVSNKIASFENMSEPVPSRFSLDSINEVKTNIINLKTKIESLKDVIASRNPDALLDKKYCLNTLSAIKTRREKIAILNSDMVSARKDYAKCKVLDEVFSNGDNGFKKYFINKVIGMFNSKVNTFLPFFFDDNIEIQFDKDLNDTIIFRGKQTEFDELSSGEKTRCELCIVFALYFMVQSIFGSGTNLMVIDEILDRGLDDIGINASKNILDDISKDSSVFVVTHRDDLKELFSHVITVYKDGDGFTKLK